MYWRKKRKMDCVGEEISFLGWKRGGWALGVTGSACGWGGVEAVRHYWLERVACCWFGGMGCEAVEVVGL